jgi:hypothetical protein
MLRLLLVRLLLRGIGCRRTRPPRVLRGLPVRSVRRISLRWTSRGRVSRLSLRRTSRRGVSRLSLRRTCRRRISCLSLRCTSRRCISRRRSLPLPRMRGRRSQSLRWTSARPRPRRPARVLRLLVSLPRSCSRHVLLLVTLRLLSLSLRRIRPRPARILVLRLLLLIRAWIRRAPAPRRAACMLRLLRLIRPRAPLPLSLPLPLYLWARHAPRTIRSFPTSTRTTNTMYRPLRPLRARARPHTLHRMQRRPFCTDIGAAPAPTVSLLLPHAPGLLPPGMRGV